MDFFFNDLPSTSQSTPKRGQDDALMTGDTAQDSSSEKSAGVNMSEIAEQQPRMDSTMLIPTEPSVDYISRRVQELVEKINDRRASDQKVMDSFQEKLVEKMTEMCQKMKENVYMVYEENSNKMQVKLQELSEVLESCTKLHNELVEANQALASLRGGLAISQIPDPSYSY